MSSPVNAQTNYRWTVNGTYVPASDGSATLTWATDSDDPTAAVQVEATRACAGSTVSATRTVTSYFPNCGGGVR